MTRIDNKGFDQWTYGERMAYLQGWTVGKMGGRFDVHATLRPYYDAGVGDARAAA